jgi:hypothetical protein
MVGCGSARSKSGSQFAWSVVSIGLDEKHELTHLKRTCRKSTPSAHKKQCGKFCGLLVCARASWLSPILAAYRHECGLSPLPAKPVDGRVDRAASVRRETDPASVRRDRRLLAPGRSATGPRALSLRGGGNDRGEHVCLARPSAAPASLRTIV